MEKVLFQSQGLAPIYFDHGIKKSYTQYISKGWFRPDFMPKIALRSEWFQFFGSLSNKYAMHFAKINAGIFLSESIFRGKQEALISKYAEKKKSILDDLLNLNRNE